MEELKIVLLLDEVNLVLNALGDLSFKVANPIIQKIMAQAEAQIKVNREKQQFATTQPAQGPFPETLKPVPTVPINDGKEV